MPERLISSKPREEDSALDRTLRPQKLDDLIGQVRVKENLRILIEAARARGEPLDHVLLYGPPGLGKCISGDSLVLTDIGLAELRQFVPPGLPPGGYAPCRVQVYGRDGLELASHVYADGRVPAIRLRTRSGFELEGTPNHPVLVATPEGPRWKPLGELTQADFVAIARGTQVWGQPQVITFQPACLDDAGPKENADQRVLAAHHILTTILRCPPAVPELAQVYAGDNTRNPTPRLTALRLGVPLRDGRKFPARPMADLPDLAVQPLSWQVPKMLDADLAYLMGVLVGNGHFERGANAPAFIITTSEPEIQQEIRRICHDKFGWTPKVNKHGQQAPQFRFSQNWGRLMIQLGVQPVLAGEQVVPVSVLAGPESVVRGFLQGLFDADGHAWREAGYVDWSSQSLTLARQVQILLANLGIISHRTAKKVQGQMYGQLFIGGRDAQVFYERVGCRRSRQQERSGRLSDLQRGAHRSDLVPFAHLALAQLFEASGPHSRALHKTFDHVERGDRLLSHSQIDKYLSYLPDWVQTLPPAARLRELSDPRYYWDGVAALEPGEAQVFDFCVPGTHSFVANGFFNHNTTLAHVIANEMNMPVRVTAGPAIERAGDLAAILTNLRAGEVLFIDEVHRLGRAVEEVLYPAMEDFALDIVIGKGPSARSIRLNLPRFTVVGATTRLALMTAPLRARFGATFRLDFYDLPAMEQIVRRAAGKLDLPIDEAGVGEIAARARGTPRVALRLLRRVRDYAQVRGDGHVTVQIAADALALLDVDALGLDDLDRRVLRAIIEKFGGGPVGLETIAASISEEADTIMDVVEPYLLQLGYLDRTPRGRVATPRAYEHLGLAYPESEQPSLL